MKFEHLATVFKALSDTTRLKILYLLGKKPLCVCEIMGTLGITQTKASRHLIYLKNAGLLDSRKEDRWVLYGIREDLPEELREILVRVHRLARKTEDLNDLERQLEEILKKESLYRQIYGVPGAKTSPPPRAA